MPEQNALPATYLSRSIPDWLIYQLCSINSDTFEGKKLFSNSPVKKSPFQPNNSFPVNVANFKVECFVSTKIDILLLSVSDFRIDCKTIFSSFQTHTKKISDSIEKFRFTFKFVCVFLCLTMIAKQICFCACHWHCTFLLMKKFVQRKNSYGNLFTY